MVKGSNSQSTQQPDERDAPRNWCRGVWTPPQVFEALRDKRITAKDFVILATIDAFTYSDGRGCFASNKYLGRSAGLSESMASRAVTKLVRQGFVRSVGEGRRRRLFTVRKKRQLTSSYKDYLLSEHWQKTRRKALKAADYACQLCSSVEMLNVHHRTYERLGCERPADLTTL